MCSQLGLSTGLCWFLCLSSASVDVFRSSPFVSLLQSASVSVLFSPISAATNGGQVHPILHIGRPLDPMTTQLRGGLRTPPHPVPVLVGLQRQGVPNGTSVLPGPHPSS